MNAQRRNKLQKIIDKLTDLKEEVEIITQAEDDALDSVLEYILEAIL